MRSYQTSYLGLFELEYDGVAVVDRIEIPIIQRDYAQGREDVATSEIRAGFLEVLRDAVAGGESVGLDFVYGDLDRRVLRPLDGQQRLTTLFLLHWYLAARTGRCEPTAPWTRLTYATRPGARLFCERLVENPPPDDVVGDGDGALSRWIADQHWYLALWRGDPTIQSMLVMADAIDATFGDLEPERAWQQLADPEQPAISFHLLPLADLDAGDDLYIKMNSRGKPLTPFENFKARFEKALSDSTRAKEFAHKVDGPWSDVLWPIHGGDYIVDDEFMRYIHFLTEVCEWHNNAATAGRLEPRAIATFAGEDSSSNLDLLFDAFDTWRDVDVADWFARTFWVSSADSEDEGGLRLFGTGAKVDLFEACCHTYGDMSGRTRVFSLVQSLLLYAVLVHRINQTEDFPRRLRLLRNLLAASDDEVRVDRMSDLIRETEQIIRDGEIDPEVTSFNQAQARHEVVKRRFLAEHPTLGSVVHDAEDHNLLRGSLVPFDLDPQTLSRQVEAFQRLFANNSRWSLITGALLAAGEYQRSTGGDTFHFGTGAPSNHGVWREQFAPRFAQDRSEMRRALGQLLEAVRADSGSVEDILRSMVDTWLEERAAQQKLDWRYYLVCYAAMREGASGIYYGVDGDMGFSLRMLNRTRLNSWYRDPYLLAIWRESGVGDAAEDPWFMGYTAGRRWLRLEPSGAGVTCDARGFLLDPPTSAGARVAFDQFCESRELEPDDDGRYRVAVAQQQTDAGLVDTEDRIQVGAQLVRDLVASLH